MKYRLIFMLFSSFAGLALFAQHFPSRLLDIVEKRSVSNFVISPLSGELALSMLAEGTSGQPQQQILGALGYATDEEARAAGRNLLDLLPTLDESVVFEPANSLWANPEIQVKNPFMQTLQDAYKAEVLYTDLTSAEGLEELDGWVSAKTHGRIPSVDIKANPDTKLALVNTLYLKAPFTYCFQERDTKSGTFHNADGTQTSVQMMYRKEFLSYAHMEPYGFDVLEMPLGKCDEATGEGGKDYVMTFFLPLESHAGLSEEIWTHYPEAMKQDMPVELTLPKFSISYELDMKEVLPEMGVTDIFNGADLSRISDDAMTLDQMRQKTVVGIDEQGVEGASATFVTMSNGQPQDVYRMTFDHPFYFAVSERSSGAVLFMGRVAAMEGSDGINTPVFDKTESVRYGLDGRRAGEDSRGIVIENGRKVLK